MAKSRPSNKTNSFSSIFAVLFILLLMLSSLLGKLPLVILGLYIITSIIAFLFYALDKSAAQNGRWRIKESNLHLLGLIGGWPGAVYAQKMLRHKTKKREFQIIFWLTVIINLFVLGWLLVTKSGVSFLRTVIG